MALLEFALLCARDEVARAEAVALLLAFVDPADREACWEDPVVGDMWEADSEEALLRATGVPTAVEFVFHSSTRINYFAIAWYAASFGLTNGTAHFGLSCTKRRALSALLAGWLAS